MRLSRRTLLRSLVYPVLFTCLWLVAATSAAAQPDTDPAKISDDEYRVYEAVIREMFTGKNKIDEGRGNASQFVILEKTVMTFTTLHQDENWQSVMARLPGASEEAAKDFVDRNKSEGKLTASLTLKQRYHLLSEDEMQKIFQNSPSGWSNFTKSIRVQMDI